MLKKILLGQNDNTKVLSEYPIVNKTDNPSLLEIGNRVAKIFRKNLCANIAFDCLRFWQPNVMALHIPGLPLDDDVHKTPYDGYVDLKKITICVSSAIGMNKFIGLHPVVSFGENNGPLTQKHHTA